MLSCRRLVLVIVLLPRVCSSQSLLQNSNFDVSIAGWTVSSEVSWASAQNFPVSVSDRGGSLQLATSGIATAEQCVEIPPFVQFTPMLLDYDLRYASEDQEDPCVPIDQQLNVSVESWQGGGCDSSNATLVEATYQHFFLRDGWNHKISGVYTHNVATHIHVLLSAKCTTHRGTTTAYFDNFWLRSDRIFQYDFDG